MPTFDEQGLKGYEVGGWFGLVGPAGLPPDVLAKLNAAMVATLQDPEVVKRIRDIGMETVPMAPQEFGAFIDKEIDKIAKVLAQAGDVPK
jgi:tripartite-type tricarboxylate transporter receptor subunit TctC